MIGQSPEFLCPRIFSVFGAIMMELGGRLLLMVGLFARWAALSFVFRHV